MGKRLHDEYQHANELLACRTVRAAGVPRTDDSAGARAGVTGQLYGTAGVGVVAQQRLVARIGAGYEIGELWVLAHGRRMVVPAPVGTLRIFARRSVPAQHLPHFYRCAGLFACLGHPRRRRQVHHRTVHFAGKCIFIPRQKNLHR